MNIDLKAIQYPFIGVQFHPEKNIFEWSEREPRIPHSRFYFKDVFFRNLKTLFSV